jgi:hypothetical protein
VIYVFGKKKLDVDDCVIAFVESLKSSHPKAVLLKHDVGYSHLAGALYLRYLAQVFDSLFDSASC